MPPPKHNQPPMYSGVIDCVRKTVRNESFRALYKGMTAPLIGVTPLYAVFFWGSSVGKRLQQRHPGEQLSILQLFYAGAFAGLLTTPITTPAERVKCILQVQSSTSAQTAKFTGSLDVIRHLWREGGIKSIYRGFCATMLRDIPAWGIYLASYEAIMKILTSGGQRHAELSIPKTLFAGGAAGILNWVLAIGPDVLKSRLQTAPPTHYPRGIRDVARELVRQEGVGALYKGFTPIMLRAFPANAACFVGYEVCMKSLYSIT